MEIKITVERRRSSVTQGMVDVLINGEKVMDFGDTIEWINPGDKYYGEMIGHWASTVPDTQFILGLLFHPFGELYKYSERAKTALLKAKEIEEDGAEIYRTELQEIAHRNGWPMKIKARGYVAYLVGVQPLNEGKSEPIYRFPGGDSLVDECEMIPTEEDAEW